MQASAAADSTSADTGVDARLTGIAFAELVIFVPTFKLSDLARMYKARLEQLDVSVPDLQAHSQGRDVLLTFDVGNAIKIMTAMQC